MNRRQIFLIGAVLLLTLACGPLGNLGDVVTGGEAGTASSLWSDVPPYAGADKVDLEMPLVMRLAVEAASKAVMSEAGDAAGNLEFIAYTTNDAPEDVQAFYSNERMAAQGWSEDEAPGCTAFAAGEEELGGGMCVFGKKGARQDSALFIVIGTEEDGQTSVFYVRIDANPEAMATASSE
jgi:hypothetical protein